MTREREKAIHFAECLKRNCTINFADMEVFCDMAIKALEQESVLDKVEEEIKDTLYVDSLIFTELIDFKNGKIDADDVIEEFNRVTRMEVLGIIDKYRVESEEEK